MLLKTLLLTLLLHAKSDSIPSLQSFHQEDVDTVTASYKEKTLTVKLKSGESFTYTHDTWRKVDDNTVLPAIKNAMFIMDATFTKVQVPPSFPGGPEAWNNYLQKACSDNRRLIDRRGPATVMLQFVVAFDGSVNDVRPITSDAPDKLIDLATHLIKDGPAWVPATQNGHVVSAYQRQLIEFK
jgi:hypothetical protein